MQMVDSNATSMLVCKPSMSSRTELIWYSEMLYTVSIVDEIRRRKEKEGEISMWSALVVWTEDS